MNLVAVALTLLAQALRGHVVTWSRARPESRLCSPRACHEALSALEIPNDLLQVIQDLLLELRVHCLMVTLLHTTEGEGGLQRDLCSVSGPLDQLLLRRSRRFLNLELDSALTSRSLQVCTEGCVVRLKPDVISFTCGRFEKGV